MNVAQASRLCILDRASSHPNNMKVTPDPVAKSVPQSGTVCIPTEDRVNEAIWVNRPLSPGNFGLSVTGAYNRKVTQSAGKSGMPQPSRKIFELHAQQT